MKKIIILTTFFMSIMKPVAAQKSNTDKSVEYANTITATDLAKHLKILASDSLQGRETGEPGQKMAADYIAEQFFNDHLKPVMKHEGEDSYFQHFDLVRKSWGEVYVETGTKRREFLKDFYLLGSLSIPQEKNVEVVFGGYGIDTEKYSDYKNIDVTNKAVLILSGEPKSKKGKSLVTDSDKPSEWASDWRKKVTLARQKGAAYVLVIQPDEMKVGTFIANYRGYLTNPRLILKYKDTPTQGDGTIFVSKEMAVEILGVSEKALAKWQRKIARKKTPKSFAIANVTMKFENKEQIVQSENVLGLVEGTDKKDEIVVVTAHYDHVGIINGEIHNGADDDGSGTVAVLEIAQAFAEAKRNGNGPRRSMLFMTVAGEEKGLLGSEFYTDHPALSLQNTVCDLNIDMIGRIDEAHTGNPDYVYLIGSDKLSSKLHGISEEMNQKYSKLALDYKYNDPSDPNRFYYRSDHYNFARYKVPVIFYFNGTHEDYHRPTDDIEKINFAKIEKIARLVFHTAWEVANREERIKVDSNKK
ncbi:M28 family peptidase [Cytophagaceae bacterium DM2B3-1]|uniref:M28 family peptidase n=1 Tax=Xanthocytophaga flava TaxID=3048013 RepID=A0ABT7CHL5_9BACT|nr:M28 family peptidase [Xanthocytophaga flavus]MDJ1493229.1 M28 family peptidase [Xanthocytophaga flavus]